MDSPLYFKQNFHMSKEQFDVLFDRLEPMLRCKKNTRPTDFIEPKMRLAIVLEFLASGSIGRHMSSIYRISQPSFYKIIDQVCDAKTSTLRDQFVVPSEGNWIEIANDFNFRWNLPNCIGAIDGRHVPIKCPDNSGSLFYNYKVRHLSRSDTHTFEMRLYSIDILVRRNFIRSS